MSGHEEPCSHRPQKPRQEKPVSKGRPLPLALPLLPSPPGAPLPSSDSRDTAVRAVELRSLAERMCVLPFFTLYIYGFQATAKNISFSLHQREI